MVKLNFPKISNEYVTKVMSLVLQMARFYYLQQFGDISLNKYVCLD